MKKLLLIVTLSISQPLFADTLIGRVVSIADGDTITVLDESNKQHKIRLSGIDAPEKAQPFGDKSKTNLSALVFDQYVTVKYNKNDRYDRIVGKVFAATAESGCQFNITCQRTLDVCLVQLKAGMAWWYRKYSDEQSEQDRSSYEAAEFQAKVTRQGVWADTNPVPPWEWRRVAKPR